MALQAAKGQLGVFWSAMGRVLDRVGGRIMGADAFEDQACLHRRVLEHRIDPKRRPDIPALTFLAPDASVIGQVSVGQFASIWYGAILRGDVAPIRIGARSSIGDRTVVHGSGGHNFQGLVASTSVGEDSHIGANCVVHGAQIGDRAAVGDRCILLDNSVIESGAMLAHGSLLPPGRKVPAGELWGGSPARLVRKLTPEEQAAVLFKSRVVSFTAQNHTEWIDSTQQEIQAFLDETVYAYDPDNPDNYQPRF